MNRFLSKPLSLIIGCLIVATSLCACRGNEVENVDLKSIRALRAGDEEYIQKYEDEAVELRKKLKDLE